MSVGNLPWNWAKKLLKAALKNCPLPMISPSSAPSLEEGLINWKALTHPQNLFPPPPGLLESERKRMS